MFDSIDGQLHQVAAVVVRPYFYVGGKNAFIELLGFCFDTLQHVLRLLATPHHDDALDRIILFVKAKFAQAWRVSDGNLTDVANTHRHPIL